MFGFILAVHNILRWIVLILLVVALVRAFWGWFGKREWTSTDRKVGMFYSVSLDIQLLLGLILYFVLSPLTTTATSEFQCRDAEFRTEVFCFGAYAYDGLGCHFCSCRCCCREARRRFGSKTSSNRNLV